MAQQAQGMVLSYSRHRTGGERKPCGPRQVQTSIPGLGLAGDMQGNLDVSLGGGCQLTFSMALDESDFAK